MNSEAKFQRTIEDFKCLNCGEVVKGNGYTNHCTACLCSLHVDINPGDRLQQCRGLMRPFKVESKSGEYIVWHRCEKCRVEKSNRASKHDSFEMLLNIAGGKGLG